MTAVIHGQIVSFGEMASQVRHEPEGALAIGDDGRILWSGPRSLLPQFFASAPVHDFGDCLVMPGLIDAHIHFPQYRMLAAPGKDLLDWLSRFTFPEESRFSSADYAAAARARGREAAVMADDYVHDNPWTAIGVAAGIGFVLGALFTRKP